MAKNILIKGGTEILSNIDTIVTRDENNTVTEWIPSDYELMSLSLNVPENGIYSAPKNYGYNRIDVNVLKDMASTVNSIGTEIDKLLEKDFDKMEGWDFLGTMKSELKVAQDELERGIITIEEYENIVKEKQAQLSKSQVE